MIHAVLLCVCIALGWAVPARAQDAQKLVAVSKAIMDAKDSVALYEAFEGAKDLYVKEHKYTELVDYLQSLARKKKSLDAYVDYYVASARYAQLRYLEDNQLWDDYFKDGNAYRDQVAAGAAGAVRGTPGTDPVHLYARLLLWQFHKDQQDAQADETLMALVKASEAYVKGNGTITPVKDAADRLLSYGERGKSRELYKLYVRKVVTSTTSNDEIKNIAADFYRAGNVELAESMYDTYLERLNNGARDIMIAALKEIAPQFAYSVGANRDVVYAEKLFKRLEDLAGFDAFDAETLYIRAFNAQKSRDWTNARDLYRFLLKRFPQSAHADEAAYKSAVITVYLVKDAAGGAVMLQAIAAKTGVVTPQVVSSIYQLGLLSQWKKEPAAAKEFYAQAISKAGNEFSETAELARERVKEIDGNTDIEENLKKFMDTAFGESSRPTGADSGIMDLNADPDPARTNKDVVINTSASLGATGCFQVDMKYLWSGHVGSAHPAADAASFTATYKHPGTKEINLVVVSPTGVVDYAVTFVDIQ